jgi:GT2 family glycosyltransferase
VGRGDLILFVDQDDLVAPSYVDAMTKALRTDKFVAARMDDKTLNEPWLLKVQSVPKNHGIPADPWPWGFGGSLGVRRDVFDRVGGFDERMIYGGEDLDLCKRVRESGEGLAFAGDALLHYRYRTSLRELFRRGRGQGIAVEHLWSKYRGEKPQSADRLWWVRRWHGGIHLALAGRDRRSLSRAIFLLGSDLGRIEGAIRFRARDR